MRGKNGQIVRAQGAVIRDPDIATLVDKAEKEYKIEPLFKVPEEVSAWVLGAFGPCFQSVL